MSWEIRVLEFRSVQRFVFFFLIIELLLMFSERYQWCEGSIVKFDDSMPDAIRKNYKKRKKRNKERKKIKKNKHKSYN